MIFKVEKKTKFITCLEKIVTKFLSKKKSLVKEFSYITVSLPSLARKFLSVTDSNSASWDAFDILSRQIRRSQLGMDKNWYHFHHFSRTFEQKKN